MTLGRRPLVAAHRGGALLWPENGLQAYRGALALGVDFVETDVHLTADDRLVLLHDPTLDRTTTGRGPVRRLTLAALRDVRLLEPDGAASPESVATLDALLDALEPTGAGLLLEIKAAVDGIPYPGIEERVLGMLRGRRLGGLAVLMAFEAATVERIRALDATMPTALLFRRRSGWLRAPDDTVTRARALGVAYLGLDHRLVHERVVAAAHAAGIRLITWVVNEPRDLGRMLKLGVDVVESDRPDVVLRTLR